MCDAGQIVFVHKHFQWNHAEWFDDENVARAWNTKTLNPA